MQAMGFDSVGQHWRTDPYGIRASVAKPNQPKTYFWNNNSDRAKTYESVRAVPNWPIYRLRAVAKMERSRLQSTVLATTPDIENETEELDTTLTLLFDYAKSSPPLLLDSKLNVRFVADPLQRALEFSNFFQQLLRHLADRLGLDPTALKVEPRENIYVEFKYAKPLSLSLDRFAVKMFFGGRTFRQLEFFDSPALEWNLGRQNPKLFQVLPTEAQMEARRQQAEQQNIEVVSVDPEVEAAAEAEGGIEELQPEVEEFDPFAAEGLPQEETGAGGGVAVTDPEKVALEAEEIQQTVKQEEASFVPPTPSSPPPPPPVVVEEELPPVSEEDLAARDVAKRKLELQEEARAAKAAKKAQMYEEAMRAKKAAEEAAAAEKARLEEAEKLKRAKEKAEAEKIKKAKEHAEAKKAAEAEAEARKKRLEEEQAQRAADLAAAEKERRQRLAEAEREKQQRVAAEQQRLQQQQAEEQRRLRQQQAEEQQRLQQQQAAEQQRRQEREEQQQRLQQQQAAEQQRLLQQQAEEQLRLQQEQERRLQQEREQQQRLQQQAEEEEEERLRQQQQAEEEERQRQILAAAAAEEEEEEGAEEEQIFVINVDPGAGGAGDPGPAVPPPAPPLPPPIVPGPAIPPPAGPPGGGGEEYEGEAGDVFVEPAFRRDRLRYLAGNARRKRRMPQQEEPELALPESLLLLLENGEEQNDFVADWGRCCVAANLSGGKVTSKAKCYADLSITEDLVFHLLDSQHLCLVRSPTESLAKIELHVYC
jgi:hypothetical protein